MGGIKASYDCIKAFSETDFTEDLKLIDLPTLVLHGEHDQIVPFAEAGVLWVKLVKKGTLKSYPVLPRGTFTLSSQKRLLAQNYLGRGARNQKTP